MKHSQSSSSNGQQSVSSTSEPLLQCTITHYQCDASVVSVSQDDDETHQKEQQYEQCYDDNHLQRDQERYSSYYSTLNQQLLWTHDHPYLGSVYQVELEQGKLWFLSEKWSDCFHDIMKLRMANHLKFSEDELVRMLYETLQALKVLEQQCCGLKVVGAGRTPKQLQEPCELLSLSPHDIALIVVRREKRASQVSFKLTNYIEQMLLNCKSKKNLLSEQLIQTEESQYYLSPELLVQFLIGTPKQEQIISEPTSQNKLPNNDYEEENSPLKVEHEREYLTCMYKGAIWSLGIIVLRCMHSKSGDFLSENYGSKGQPGKLEYIKDLLALCKETQDSLYCPVPSFEIDVVPLNSLQKWISGSLQEPHEFSWPLREMVRQMLISNVVLRPSVSELLDSPLFFGLEHQGQPSQVYEPVTLGVFLSLTKLNMYHQLSLQFFSTPELIDLAKGPLKRMMLIKKQKKQCIKLSTIRNAIAQKINQICATIRQDGVVSRLTVEELVLRIAKIATSQSDQSRRQDQETQSVQGDDETKTQTQLSSSVLKKMNIFSRVGGGLFGSTKRSESPGEKSVTLMSTDSFSTVDSQVGQLTPLSNIIALQLLIKLLTTASDKTFKTFIGRYAPHMGIEGVFWRGVRNQVWPRTLGVENQTAQREIINLSLQISQCIISSKWVDHLQARKDIPRCHQYDAFANSYYGKIMLSKVLRVFINLNTTNFYLQGMDAMALVLLSAMNYDWELAVICLQEFYNKKMICSVEEMNETSFKEAFNKKLQEKLLIYRWILNFQDPSLLSYLDEIGFLSEMYVVSWFTNFFAMDFEVTSVIRIWDYLLLQDDNFEVFFALAIMCELRETLLLKDSSGIMSCIKNLQGIVSISLCLKYAQHLQTSLPKNFITLTYTTNQVRQSMLDSDFLSERPWETPMLWEQLWEKRCFELSVFDLMTLLRETRNHHPSFLLMLDLRTQKGYEEVCLQGSIFANFLSGKINNPLLLKYLELKNIITGSIDQFKDELEVATQPDKKTPAHKPLGFVVLVWDYETQINEIIGIQNYLIDSLHCKKVCILKGGVQAAMVDGGEAIKFKNKTTMPAFIKKELDDLKNINL